MTNVAGSQHRSRALIPFPPKTWKPTLSSHPVKLSLLQYIIVGQKNMVHRNVGSRNRATLRGRQVAKPTRYQNQNLNQFYFRADDKTLWYQVKWISLQNCNVTWTIHLIWFDLIWFEQVMKTVSSDGRLRRWQWEMRKRRRPPMLNTWYHAQ